MTFGSTSLDTPLLDEEGKVIQQVSSMKDLGVVLQDNGKFDILDMGNSEQKQLY
jgi:hypothetical protein